MTTLDSQVTQPPTSRWQRFSNWLIAPAATVTEIGARRQARLLAATSLLVSLLAFTGVMASARVGDPTSTIVIIVTMVGSFATYALSRTKWYRFGAFLFVALFTLGFLARLSTGKLDDPALTLFAFIPITLVLASAFLSLRGSIVTALINLGGATLLSYILPDVSFANILLPVGVLAIVATFTAIVIQFRNAVERDRLAVIQKTNEELSELHDELDDRVQARTAELELAAEVGRSVSQVQDLDTLLAEAAQLIATRFNLYHAQIYLSDMQQRRLVLRAGTGEVGATLLDQGHFLPFESESINCQAMIEKQPILVADTSANPVFQPNPLLPFTRSEVAFPLIVGDTVLGVLDMQSSRSYALSEQSLPALTAMAGQLAVAIQNALSSDELRLSEEQLAQAAAAASMASWELDLRTEQYTLNDQFYALLGTSLDELDTYELPLDSFLSLFVEPDDIPLVRAEIAGAQRRHDPDAFGHFEVRLRRADGTVQFAQVDYRVELDQEGHAQRAFGSHLDITARKLAETQALAEQERLKAVLESVSVPLLVSRVSDGVALYFNDAMAAVAGQTREQLVGSATPDFYYNPADRHAYLAQLQQEGFINNYELRLRQGDGTPFWALVSARITNFAGEQAIITTLVDITARRESQDAIAKRAIELEAVAQVGATATNILEEKPLLQQVVDLTKKSFDLYHAHVYLLNDKGETLVLTAGAGDIGQHMVNQGHHISLKQPQSLVARAARTRQGVIVNDVQDDPGFLPNPLLPHTRAEMAVPMIVGNKVLGVIDVQGTTPGQFTQEDVNIQTTLATQVAVALQNARSFGQVQQQAAIIDSAETLLAMSTLDGRLTFVNRAGAEMVGYAPEEVVGQRFMRFFPRAEGRRMLREQFPQVLAEGVWRGESTLKGKDGRLIPVDQTLFIVRDENQQPLYIASNMIDITARKKTEKALQAALTDAETFRRLVETSTQGVGLADPNGTIRYVNPALVGMMERDVAADLQGETFISYYAEKYQVVFTEEVFPTLMADGTWQGENEMTLPSGRTIPTLESYFLLQNEQGQTSNIAVIITDISDRRQAEEAQQQLQAQMEEQLQQMNALQRAMTRDGWQAFLKAESRKVQGYQFNQDKIRLISRHDIGHQDDRDDPPLTASRVLEMAGNADELTAAAEIKIRGEQIGLIGARKPDGTPVDPETQNLLQQISGQVAEALERARLFEETEMSRQQLNTQAQELTILNEISEIASAKLRLEDLLDTVGQQLQKTFAAESVTFSLYDEKSGMISFPYFHSFSDGKLEVAPKHISEPSFAAQVIEGRAPLLHHVAADHQDEVWEEKGANVVGMMKTTDSYLGVPMIVGDRITGVLAISSYSDVRVYDESDQRLLSTLAGTLSVAIENARQFQRAQRRAERETMLNVISQKIQSATTIDTALQTAVSELGQALNLKKARVQLDTREEKGQNGLN